MVLMAISLPIRTQEIRYSFLLRVTAATSTVRSTTWVAEGSTGRVLQILQTMRGACTSVVVVSAGTTISVATVSPFAVYSNKAGTCLRHIGFTG